MLEETAFENGLEPYPLMTCEVLYMLEEQRTKMVDEDKPKQYVRLFESVLNYAETCSKVKSRGRAETLRSFLAKFGLLGREIAAIGTLFPQSVDEARILVPTLGRYKDEELAVAIKQIDEL